MDSDRELLEETRRLAQDTNRMLHTMRRNAFWGGLLKFIIYAALISAPIWFYMTYLNESVQRMLHAIDQMNSAGANVSTQMGGFEAAFKNLESKLPSFMQGPASTSSSQ